MSRASHIDYYYFRNICSYIGNKSVVEANRNLGPNFRDRDGFTALIASSERGDLKCVKELLQEKADPNIQDIFHQYTALMFACERGHLEIVKELLLAKANPNLTSIKYCPAIYFTIRKDIAKEMILAKADINKKIFNDYCGFDDVTIFLKRHLIVSELTKEIINENGEITTVFPFPTTSGGHIKLFELIAEYTVNNFKSI